MLLQLYRSRVDAVFKVVHWPTAINVIESTYADAENASQSPTTQALQFAMYFAAACSVTEFDPQTLLTEDKWSLVQRYRLATEVSISKANLFHYPDLTLLQAFVIYLVSGSSSLLDWILHCGVMPDHAM